MQNDTLAYKKLRALFLLLICIFYLLGCAAGPVARVHKGEVWKGTITGTVTGNVEIVFSHDDETKVVPFHNTTFQLTQRFAPNPPPPGVSITKTSPGAMSISSFPPSSTVVPSALTT